MQITQHSVVTIHYRLSNAQGELIEDSFDGQPMVYIHGAENIIPGLENALTGKKQGDKIDVTIESNEAYGPHQAHMRQEVALEAFAGVDDIVPGMRFMADTESGPVPVVVAEVLDNTVIVDGNHPLAGQDLTFNVEIIDVREATAEEIAHGHIHNDGGCCGGGSGEGDCCGGHGEGDCCSGHDHKH